jgi:hypothetical protein
MNQLMIVSVLDRIERRWLFVERDLYTKQLKRVEKLEKILDFPRNFSRKTYCYF